MSGIRRPKTAGPGGALLAQEQKRQHQQLLRRPGSQMSQRASADDSCWPQYVPIRRVPSSMQRHIEVQTEQGLPPAMGGNAQPPAESAAPAAVGGGALFYPYYVPGIQQQDQQQRQQDQQQQPFVLLSPWQLPGYQNLPVLDPAQIRMLGPMLQRPHTGIGRAHPLDGAPIYRSGRNGSSWRHIRQCTGNLGNNIMFLDGHVKEEDCRRFPPHGYASMTNSAGGSGLSVYGRLAPKAQPRTAAGIPLGSYGGGGGGRTTPALERARAGNKYWVEDRKSATLVPNTIQGRIMKTGSAY